MTDLFSHIAEERLALAQEVESFTEAEWTTPSALKGWQVRHVVAHLVWPIESSTAALAFGLLRNGFNLRRTADWAAARDRRGRVELAAALRTHAHSRFTPPGLGPAAPLTDIVVHGLDIRQPLGRRRAFPEERVLMVLKHLTRPGNLRFFGIPAGFSFAAEDVGFRAGEGPLIQANSQDLLLTLTGRSAVLDRLSGAGVPAFRAAFREYG